MAPAGATLFTAGACPLDAEGRVVAPGDHVAQATVVVDNLLEVLARHDAVPEQLVEVEATLPRKQVPDRRG